ncbi:hypothetical protein F4777DRAFT_544573 [Nemania sp. FL0916]|nr:hypothetical protein F4777DRAFT_544573 [Nemania sp. FL0916]
MSKPSSESGKSADPKKPPRTITRRRGACKGCKLKKIRCNGGTPCSACDRTGSTCNYEPRPRGASDVRDSDHHISGKRHVPDQPDHTRDHPTGSVESEGLESANGAQPMSLVGSSPAMFSIDPNSMDFLFSSPSNFAFPNPAGDLGITQAAPLPNDYHVIEGMSGTQYSVNHSIPSTMPLETGEFEGGRSTAAGSSVGALSSPWPSIERRMTQVTELGLPEYCRADADIDFRFTTSFGLAELPTPRGDSRKHLEICRILRSLTKSQSPTSKSKDNVIIFKSGHSLSKTTHEATIQRCIIACFEGNAEIPLFLRKANVAKKISEVRESPNPDVVSSLFSDAIIAMGLNALRNSADDRCAPALDGIEQFRSLLDGLADLDAVPSSLLKLQTSVLLSIIASNINDSRLSETLSIGVHCVRELRFTSSNIIRKTITHADDQKLAKRSVWVLYCLETSYSVTRGIPPLLHPDFIDHLPAASDHVEKHDTLVLQIAAAALLARSLSRVYVQPTSAKTTAELQACTAELGRWRSSLSDHARQLVAGRGFESLRGDDDAGAKLRLFCAYHECVYLLFAPWLPPLLESASLPQVAAIHGSDSLSDAETGSRSPTDRRLALVDTLERCLESAYTIVSHANEIIAVDKTLARRLYGLMIISVCVIAYGVLYGDQGTKKTSLPYLGICCGTFGGMHLADSSLPFEEILDLVRIIRTDSL